MFQAVLKQNKSQVSHPISCRKTTKGSLQNAVGHASIHPVIKLQKVPYKMQLDISENPECYLRPCC